MLLKRRDEDEIEAFLDYGICLHRVMGMKVKTCVRQKGLEQVVL